MAFVYLAPGVSRRDPSRTAPPRSLRVPRPRHPVPPRTPPPWAAWPRRCSSTPPWPFSRRPPRRGPNGASELGRGVGQRCTLAAPAVDPQTALRRHASCLRPDPAAVPLRRLRTPTGSCAACCSAAWSRCWTNWRGRWGRAAAQGTWGSWWVQGRGWWSGCRLLAVLTKADERALDVSTPSPRIVRSGASWQANPLRCPWGPTSRSSGCGLRGRGGRPSA